jgi:hypothetical protein
MGQHMLVHIGFMGANSGTARELRRDPTKSTATGAIFDYHSRLSCLPLAAIAGAIPQYCINVTNR